MIDLKEVRLGNWFHHNENWCYRRGPNGTSLYDGEFDFKFEDRDWYAFGEGTLSSDDISPILITPEWLEKLGFPFERENEHISIWKHKRGLYLLKNKTDLGVGYKLDRWYWTTDCHDVELQYVHEVQNFFNSAFKLGI